MSTHTIATSTLRYSRPCRWCQGEGRVVKPSRLNPGTGALGECNRCHGKGWIQG